MIGWPMHYTVDELNNMINKYGSPGKILKRFEYVPENDLPLYYSACDAVVFPYNKMYTGGTGPLTKGACAYGKPVIITNVSGMFELVKKHKFGLIAEAQNPYSIAEKMKEFMNLNEAQKMELSKNSLTLGRLCSWDNMAYRVVEILKKASNSRDNYAH